jgi:capsular polysaccharide biosynthesis protein
MEEMDLEIQDIFRILKNIWKTIVGITTIITLFVGAISFFVIKPVYEVNTKVFIGKDETKDIKYDNNDVAMYQKLLATYAELIKTNDLIENAINENNIDITASAVMSTLAATPRTDTQILQITYKNNDNELAKEVLVSVVDELIKEAKILIPNGTVKVIESAELPQHPVSPDNAKNIAVGFLGGLIFGIIISLLIEYMGNTFKTKEQIEKIMDISVIGVIPCEDNNYKRRKDKYIKKITNKNLNDPAYEN